MTRDDAIKVLKEVQNARETLENNILEVCRKHEQVDLFGYFDRKPLHGGEENYRIKKKVSEKIKEINNEIQEEVYPKETPNYKATMGYTSTRHGNYPTTPRRRPLTQINKRQTSANLNSNLPCKPLKQKLKKGKTREVKKSEPPPKSSTAYDELVLQHIYGRQPHQAHRHTFRNDNPAFCSPRNVAKKVQTSYSSAPTQAKQVLSDVQVQPTNEYYIHLQPQNHIPFSIDHNFPNAITLVEPSRCLSERLPISSTMQKELVEEKSSIPDRAQKQRKHLSRAGPNVAVINIKSDDMGERGDKSAIKDRIKAKVRERMRNRMKLNIQPLPNVDIDTTDPSTLSTISDNSSHVLDSDTNNDIKETNVSEANVDEEPCNFQDFITVQDLPGKSTNNTDEEDEPDESLKQPEIFLPGCKTLDERNYHGPTFPPRQFTRTQDNVIDILPVKMSSTLEQNAHDWIEKELLARLITQMMDREKQEPVREFADQANVQPIQDEDVWSSYDWVDNIIGLQGIQLFVDAGIPVNKDLVRELIRTVILECLETLFGHPPRGEVSAPASDEPVVETNIPTPPQTPGATLCASEQKEEAIKTPDQTISELTEQIINDTPNGPSLYEDDGEQVHYETMETPDVSIVEKDEDVLNNNITTPDVSLVQEKSLSLFDDVKTPSNSEKALELTQIPLSDFEFTEKITSHHSPVIDERFSTAELEVTPPPIVVHKKILSVTTSPSTPSTTCYTISSSTTLGFSTFEGISIGEYLNSNSGVSNGSVGELRQADAKSLLLLEDNVNVEDSYVDSTKQVNHKHTFPSKQLPQKFENSTGDDDLSAGEIIHPVGRQLKSIGEVSDQSNFDSEGIENDTDELSFAKAVNNDEMKGRRKKEDPVIKLLDKINSTRDYSNDDFLGQESSYKSEGEVVVPHQSKTDEKQVVSVSSGENILRGGLTLGMVNQESRLVHVQDEKVDCDDYSDRDDRDENIVPVSPTGNVINVQPVYQNVNRKIDFSDKRTTDCDVSNNNTYSHIQDISKSEGEFLNAGSDTVGEELDVELSDAQSLSIEGSEHENDKVVMVLRLPEVDDDQNVTDYDISHDDISTLSEL